MTPIPLFPSSTSPFVLDAIKIMSMLAMYKMKVINDAAMRFTETIAQSQNKAKILSVRFLQGAVGG